MSPTSRPGRARSSVLSRPEPRGRRPGLRVLAGDRRRHRPGAGGGAVGAGLLLALVPRPGGHPPRAQPCPGSGPPPRAPHSTRRPTIRSRAGLEPERDRALPLPIGAGAGGRYRGRPSMSIYRFDPESRPDSAVRARRLLLPGRGERRSASRRSSNSGLAHEPEPGGGLVRGRDPSLRGQGGSMVGAVRECRQIPVPHRLGDGP